MLRCFKRAIPLFSDVSVSKDGLKVKITGPKGSASLVLHDSINLEVQNESLLLSLKEGVSFDKRAHKINPLKALIGTNYVMIQNFITGVKFGFERKLQLVGIGYKVEQVERELIFSLGFSHPVNIDIPNDIDVLLTSPIEIIIKGIDKQRVGQYCASIKKLRKIDRYKGKGIRYHDEIILLKEVKK